MKSPFLPENPKMFSQPIQGITDRLIAYDQPGRVKFQGSYWSAKLYQPNQQLMIAPGKYVNVIAIEGITLLVVPVGFE